MDYLYEKGSRNNIVLIAHRPQYSLSFGNPPYTDDVAEMEHWIAENKSDMEKEWQKQGATVSSISAEKFARTGVAVKMTTKIT